MQKAVIFGRGQLYKQKEKYLKKNYIIKGFLDNGIKENEVENRNTDVPVYCPKNTDSYLEEDLFIILMSYSYASMWRQLNKLGISPKSILFGVTFPPLSDCEAVLFSDGGRLLAEEDGKVYYYNHNEKTEVKSHREIQERARQSLREKFRRDYPIINAISKMDVIPVSREFGLERGTAIDRYYIEHFLEKHKSLIRGDCLEIAENTYTMRYGGDRVKKAYILHLEGWGENTIKGNLETGEGIEEEKYDCAVITQTLMFIFDIRRVAENIYKLLKRGGNALITVAGISQISRYDADLWGSYYGFQEDAMKALFEPVFGKENVEVEAYGNVKTAIALLCGLCREDLNDEDFSVKDKDYPVIITVLLHKDVKKGCSMQEEG